MHFREKVKEEWNEGGREGETELRYNDGFTPASFVLTAVAAIVDHVQSPESNAGGLDCMATPSGVRPPAKSSIFREDSSLLSSPLTQGSCTL